MIYADYVSTMVNLLVIDSPGNDDFVQILPTMIAYAENRIQSDIDLAQTIETINGVMATGNRQVVTPATIEILDSINVITPAGNLPNAVGSERGTVTRMSIQALNGFFPSAAVNQRGVPLYYAMPNLSTIVFGPVPDAAYNFEVIGVYHVDPISGTNPSNYISEFLPEMLIAASMVFGTGWQRDFGSQSDDPRSSQSWEAQYQALLASNAVQEARKKAKSTGWSSFSPEKDATPPRAA